MGKCPDCGSTDIRLDYREKYCGKCGTVVGMLYDTEIEFQKSYGNLPKIPSKYPIHKERMRTIQKINREANVFDCFDDLRNMLHINKTLKESIEREFKHLYDGLWNSKVITGRGWSWKNTAKIILYTLLFNRAKLKYISLLGFTEKFSVFGGDGGYDENEADILGEECKKYKELAENLEHTCREKRFDVERASIILGKKLDNRQFYYTSAKIDPSIGSWINKIEINSVWKSPLSDASLREVFSIVVTDAWGLFYKTVNELRPKHKMTGLFCACLLLESKKLIESFNLKIKLKDMRSWSSVFGISYETLNLRLRQLSHTPNL